MTAMSTDRLGLPLLSAGQAQKEITHNEALLLLDMLVQPVAESADLAAPPSTPEAGQVWIVAASASGDWAGMGDRFAIWTGSGWRFAAPRAGSCAWVMDRAALLRFDGSSWAEGQVRVDGFHVAGIRVVAAQQSSITDPAGGSVSDTEARAAIIAILSAMRAHGLIET